MPSEEATWLLRMQLEHLDLRAPQRLVVIEHRLETGGAILLRDERGPIGHLDMRRLAGVVEIHSVVIDASMRGQGLSHRLIHQAWERWRQDPILHGRPLVEDVNLAAAVRGEDITPKSLSKPLIAFTRNPAMGAALSAAGFKIASKHRCWWKLWLGRSRLTGLPLRTRLHLIAHRFVAMLRMGLIGEHLPESAERAGVLKRFLQRRRRLLHQLSHLDDYELFMLGVEMQDRRWPRRGAPSELSEDPLRMMRMTHYQPGAGNGDDELRIEAWDEGREGDSIPFVDLAEEE